MLPESKHGPSLGDKLGIGPLIPRSIFSQLLRPKLCIVLWLDSMMRAAMPEAAINEYDQLETDKYDIRSAWNSVMNPISQSHCPQRTTKGDFGLRVLPPDARHAIAALLWGKYIK